MLTKEERKAIADRLNYSNDTDYYSFYKAVTGHSTTTKISLDEDVAELEKIIADLCDTSNMIELPLDKDGEVIHIGDTVFDDYNGEWVVNGIVFKSNGVLIDTFFDGDCTKLLPYELTHKQPATIQQLSERMQAVIDAYGLAVGSDLSMKLVDIADQLKELAGKDE